MTASGRQVYFGARIFDGLAMRDDCALIAEDGAIVGLTGVAERPRGGVQHDLGGGILAPGFVDAQVNGGGGVFFNATPTLEAIEAIAAAHLKFGTTSLLPTVITDAPSVLTAALASAGEAVKRKGAALGIHVEGPFIDSLRKGVHPPQHIRAMTDADADALIAARRGVMLVTLAPVAVSNERIHKLAQAGVVVALGHSDCDVAAACAAFDAGARAVTHLYNAMSQMSGRQPGLVGAALADSRIICSFIADGHHVHASAAKAAIAAKGPGGIALVSDAMPPAAGGPPSFDLMGRHARLIEGRLATHDNTLAGAAITMLDALRYVVGVLGRPLADALQMATLTPARMLGCQERVGRLAPGALANMIHLGEDLALLGVWSRGRAQMGV